MQVLESYLAKFDSLSENAAAFVDPLAIVQDLKNLCFNEVSESDLNLCSSLLFSGDHNILKFLKKTILNQEKNFVKTKEALLIFINEYIKLVEKKIQDHALEIKDTCYSIFRREQSNIVKIATFKPIMRILELKLQFLDGERLGIREMAESYLREFTYGKASQTVKSLVLQLMGMFAEFFPDFMSDKSKQLLQLLLESLKTQFKSKKPDMQIISGSLKGMSSLLVNFSNDFTADPKNIQTLYQYVCLSLELPPHVNRYDIPKAGLRVITTHASLLKAYLTEDSESMYNRLNTLCKHQNKKLRDGAFAALESFLKQVAIELTSGQRNLASDQVTFKFFIRKFYDLLESQSSSIFELSIAIRGLGHFALPIQQFAGVWEVKKILTKMFNFSERFSSKQEQLEETVLHLSSFISSYS